MSKPELTMQHVDEWMIRWRHYQTEEDWKIEKAFQARRQRNYGITAAVFTGATLYTAGPATINRIFGAPHFFDMGVDVAVKDTLRNFINGRRRFTPNGYGRIASIVLPTYLTVCALEHFNGKKRLEEYKKVETVFGEQTRRFIKNGKIDEFLAVNIKATLPANEAVILA